MLPPPQDNPVGPVVFSVTLNQSDSLLLCVIFKDVSVGHQQLKIQNTKPVLLCDCHIAFACRMNLHH